MATRQHLIQLFVRDISVAKSAIIKHSLGTSRAICPLRINVLPISKLYEIAFAVGCIKFVSWFFSAATCFGTEMLSRSPQTISNGWAGYNAIPTNDLLLIWIVYTILALHARAPEKQVAVSILLTTTDLVNEARIRGQLEIRRFMKALTRGLHRDHFAPRPVTSCRPDDLVDQMEEYNPRLVQISGHGHPDGILFEGENGESRLMGGQNLVNLFRRASQRGLQVVVLNSCHSNIQAQELVQIIACTIGICGEISDRDGITLTSKFWSALSKGETIEGACEISASSIGFDFETVLVT